jgi:hypothetical protein
MPGGNPNHDPHSGEFTSGPGGASDIHRDMSKDGNVDQGVKSIDQLYANARAAEPDFNKQVSDIASMYKGEAIFSPESSPGSNLKKIESATRKLSQEDIGGDPSKLADIMRATVAFDDVATARTVAADFIAHNDVVRVKDWYARADTGYRDLLVNYRTTHGFIAELQFNTRSMVTAKDGGGHTIYERIRETKDSILIKSLYEESNVIYDRAYKASGNGNWTQHT